MLRKKGPPAAHAVADLGPVIDSGHIVFCRAQIGSDVMQGAERKPEIGGEACQGLARNAARQDIPQNRVWEAVRGGGCVDLLHDSRIPQLGFRPAGVDAAKNAGVASYVTRERREKSKSPAPARRLLTFSKLFASAF